MNIFIDAHRMHLIRSVRLVAVSAAVALLATGECRAFDLLEGLGVSVRAIPASAERNPIKRDDLRRMAQNVHDVPLRELNAGERALFDAAAAGDLNVLKKMADSGVNVSTRDLNGDSALALAVRGSHFEAVRELLARGAWPNGKARDGRTPLATAAMRGQVPITRALLRAGARPDEFSDNKNTALTLAVMFGHAGVVRELVKAGADTSLPSGSSPLYEGQTPLIMGAVLGEQEIIDVLLANGADPDLMDPDRKTALYWALLRGHRQIAETLLKKGGNPDLLPIPLCRFSFDPVLSACVQSE